MCTSVRRTDAASSVRERDAGLSGMAPAQKSNDETSQSMSAGPSSRPVDMIIGGSSNANWTTVSHPDRSEIELLKRELENFKVIPLCPTMTPYLRNRTRGTVVTFWVELLHESGRERSAPKEQ